MNLTELSKASGVSTRKIRDLHSVGLLHSPVKRKWPAANVDIINTYALNKKYIHRDSMRKQILRDIILGRSRSPVHTVLVEGYSPEDLYAPMPVLNITQNKNSGVSMEELLVTAVEILAEAGNAFYVPRDSITKAMALASNGYNPCWIRSESGNVRTTLDMMGICKGNYCVLSSDNHRVLGTNAVLEWLCMRLEIEYFEHPKPLFPAAILTQKEGENFWEYAVFKQNGKKPLMEAIGILL